MKVQVAKNQIVITLPIDKHPSKSGKSTVIATTGGNQPTTATVDGEPLIVGCTCYIKRKEVV
jgi:hypothetical protein